MGYRDSDDSGFSRHGMNRDNDHPDAPQHAAQRPYRAGYDHPDLDRDEDLRTSHSIPADALRAARSNEPAPGSRRDGPSGYPGPRSWEGRDRYAQGQGSYRSEHDTGYGYGARAPYIGGYDPYGSEQRHRQQQQHGAGNYGPDDRARLNRPEGWAREGYGAYDRDQQGGGAHAYGSRQGRSYGYGYDGRPDGGPPSRWDHRQEGYGPAGYGNDDRYQSNAYPQQYRSQQRHDPDYAAWRQEQLRLLDEDYESWRTERYQKFSDEFNTWRSTRSRNEGLRGSNQSDQTTSASGKNQPGSSNNAGTPGAGSTAPSGKTKD